MVVVLHWYDRDNLAFGTLFRAAQQHSAAVAAAPPPRGDGADGFDWG
jgi:hypothetical protein